MDSSTDKGISQNLEVGEDIPEQETPKSRCEREEVFTREKDGKRFLGTDMLKDATKTNLLASL